MGRKLSTLRLRQKMLLWKVTELGNFSVCKITDIGNFLHRKVNDIGNFLHRKVTDIGNTEFNIVSIQCIFIKFWTIILRLPSREDMLRDRPTI